MKTYSNSLQYELGLTPNTLGIKPQLMYWRELVAAYGVDGLKYALPFAFFVGSGVYVPLKEEILARKDAVTIRCHELLAREYSWGLSSSPLEAVKPSFRHARPLSVERLNGLALELAVKFNGKGLRFAMAHYLAPSLLSPEIAVNGKHHMTDFTRVVLAWGNAHTTEFHRLLATEFAAYSAGVLAAVADGNVGAGVAVVGAGATPTTGLLGPVI